LPWGRVQRRYAQARHVALTLAVLSVLAGCATGQPAWQAERTTGTAMPALAVAQAVLTTNASSLREKWYRNGAEQQLTALCMKRLGFAYPVPETGPVPNLNTITAFALGSGHPATYGITPESLIAEPPSDPEADHPGYQLALAGPPGAMREVTLPGGEIVGYETEGCRANAREQLYGSVEADAMSVDLPQIEGNLFIKFLSSTQTYLSALHKWQACMRADKFSVTSPEDAADSLLQLSDKISAAALMRQQTAMAASDASCDGPSHLRRRTNQALAKFVGSLSPRVLMQLNDVARSQAKANQMARQIVSP
jgi:hypothetical protein